MSTDELAKVAIPATRSDVNKTAVLAVGPGQDLVEVIINEVDDITGIILTVVVKDENKRARIIEVKDKIVFVLPSIVRFILRLFGQLKTTMKS